MFLSLSFPHLFPLLCGVDVSYETPLFCPVLRVLPWQFSLRQVVPDAIQPSPLWSSSPSFPRHLHRHHSLAYVFVFSSQYMPIPLQPTFLHFLGYFFHLRCPSNSLFVCLCLQHIWIKRMKKIPLFCPLCPAFSFADFGTYALDHVGQDKKVRLTICATPPHVIEVMHKS